ncbi:hypothetical protein ACHAXR_010311 [Thalassiosira sp. AJA248-18]
MTSDTINHLLRLSAARQIRDRIRDLAWGRLAPGSKLRHRRERNGFSGGDDDDDHVDDYFLSAPTVSFAHDLHQHEGNNASSHWHNNSNNNNNNNAIDDEEEEGGSMHLALRAPANKGLTMRDPYSSDRRSKSKNVLDEIHKEWRRIQSLTDSLRLGSLRGASGRPLCDVVVVSAGGGAVVPHALEFVYRALVHNEEGDVASLVDSSLLSLKPSMGAGGAGGGGNGNGGIAPSKSGLIDMVTTPFKAARSKSNHDLQGIASPSKPHNHSSCRRRKLKVLTSMDPNAIKETISGLSPATTMVVTLSLDAVKDKECRDITLAVKDWLLSGLMDASSISDMREGGRDKKARVDAILQKHMFAVTNNDPLKKFNLKKLNPNAFLVPRHSRCEAFNVFSAAGLLPLSLIFGWNIISELISGAHDMDCHFQDTNPRHNLPIIISLVDLWNDAFLHSRGRVLSPYVPAFGSYPAIVAAIEDKVLNGPGKSLASSTASTQGPSPVIDGGCHSLYDNCLRHSNTLSAEFIVTMDPPISPGTEDSALANHDINMCSLIAHADTLAFSDSNGNNTRGRFEFSSPGSPPMIQSVDSMLSHSSVNGNGGADNATMSGNQPSTLLVCGKCDAFTCGQLLALAEHRALVKAWLWDIDPFFAAVKSSVQEERHEYLSDKLHQMYHILSMGENLDDADESLFPNEKGANDAENHGTRSMHSASKTVLKHYVTRMQKRRYYNMPRTPLRGG